MSTINGEILVWMVSMTSMFAFLSIFWWSLQRRREREAYYRYELARQLLERAQEPDHRQFLVWLKKERDLEEWRRRQGVLLGAFVLMASGAGFLLMLHEDGGKESLVGWVPVLIGLSMLLYLGISGISRPGPWGAVEVETDDRFRRRADQEPGDPSHGRKEFEDDTDR